MRFKTAHRHEMRSLALAFLATILLPSCGEAEQRDTTQPAATEPVQVAQVQPGASPARTASGSGGQPNIVVIMGDDIGMWNIGAYHRGMMAGTTPNIDKLAAEGACRGLT